MKSNKLQANNQSILNTVENDMNQSMRKATLYVQNKEKKCELVVPGMHRINVHHQIPNSLHDTKLDLVFSANIYRRLLEVLYLKLIHVYCSLFLIEVLQTGYVIRMFMGNPIKRNLTHAAVKYFTFILSLNSKCFQQNLLNATTNNNPKSNQINTDLSLVVKDNYKAIGINKNGSCALHINEDMIEGESNVYSIHNKPLAGDEFKEFEIGLV